MDDDGPWIRPALWAGIGTLLALVGLGLGLDEVPTLIRLGQVNRAPSCTTEFADGCTTERAAVLKPPGYSARSWLAGDQRWWARVPAGTPGPYGPKQERFDVPRQDGQEKLAAGMAVTVVYYAESPAWIRLPSGAVLETEAHPRRRATVLAWVALGFLGSGIFAIRTGTGSGRHGDGWLRPTPARVRGGPDLVLALAGILGAFGLGITGGIVWPGIAGGLLGAGLGVLFWILAWRAGHRRPVAHG
jgi:hypothetical protein